MIGNLIIRAILILTTLTTLGSCNIAASISVGQSVYKGAEDPVFLGGEKRLLAVKWIDQGPVFKWVGADADPSSYNFHVREYGFKDSVTWTMYNTNSRNSEWTAFNIGIHHLKTDESTLRDDVRLDFKMEGRDTPMALDQIHGSTTNGILIAKWLYRNGFSAVRGVSTKTYRGTMRPQVASRCEWHQQRGGPTGPSLYNPSAQGQNPIAFMTPPPGSRPAFPNPNISASDRSLSQATFSSSEYSDLEVQNRSDPDRSLEHDDRARSVSESLEYVSLVREHTISHSEDEGSGNMICDQSNSETGLDLEKMHNLHLKFTIYSQQGVNPARGPTAFKSRGKPKYFTHIFKGKKFPINIANYDFEILKARLFELANQMGEKAEGNSFIFQAADLTNSVDFIGYINTHNIYNKGAEQLIQTNEDVKNFFLAVLSNPKKISGIEVSMHDPSKKEKQVELDISIGQHKLQARNLSSNVPTNKSDLAHSTPEDPVDKAMAALMLKYSTANNNTSEGWRVTNPECVTVDVPPTMAGFQWVDLKNPLILQTANTNRQRVTYEHPTKFPIGGIAEAQGFDIELDPYDVKQVRTHASMEDYMEFALVRMEIQHEACRILLEHKIDSFNVFLYPKQTDLTAILNMGITRGTAI
ncbi:hypothetical protein DFH28DRAFT_1156181 [Melampsora americana]|nr:hypothetical protein DFH28DRAFT_1156181 [Melampsora americana]